jgi:flagellar capping protein FliD
LRNIASSVNTPRTGTVQNLFSLGISSNGQNNLFTLSDPSQLAVALTSNPTGVQALFTDPTTGIASQMATYTQNATGTNGILPLKRADANTEYNDLGQMVNRQEAIVQNTTDNLQSQFVKMEQSLASMNQQQQLIYLQFGTPPNANPPSFQAFA